ncbi:TolC family protein [Planctomycetota bacterium]
MKKLLISIAVGSALLIACPPGMAADNAPPKKEEFLTLEEFVRKAAKSDTEFEAILIEELRLKYTRRLALPAPDLVLSVRQEHNVLLYDDDREEPATRVGLSKLFPISGTELSAEFSATPSSTSDTHNSEITFSISQPIARNAFGRTTRLLDRIVGLENDIARHQIVEAYEDYLASIMIAYHSWQECWQNLQIGRSSYEENLKLLENVKKRQANQIAKPIDVNKVTLQVLAKQEMLIVHEEDYKKELTAIRTILRHNGGTELIPRDDGTPPPGDIVFQKAFTAFLSDSRTFRILELLENKSSLEVDREADDLLPSIDLVAGTSSRGEEYDLDSSDETVFIGIDMEWPFPNSVKRAELENARITLRRAEIDRESARYRLHTGIKSLFHELRKEKRLIEVAAKKIELAKSILKDETENYSFGKVTLNDYISAVNTLDSQRFNRIQHEARYRKLMTEWKRLTDRLITKPK